MKLFSFRKPLSLNMADGTYVVNDLARNHRYCRIHHKKLGEVLLYRDLKFPETMVYYTPNGRFILLEKSFVSSVEEAESFQRVFFSRKYLPNGDSYEIRRVYLSNGTVFSQLIERTFTLQICTKIFVFTSRLTNGVWQRKGELPAAAVLRWKNALRAYCRR